MTCTILQMPMAIDPSLDKQLLEEKAKRKAEETECGKKLIEENRTADAIGVIVAEMRQDDSDIQSDYFASHSTRTVILAFTKTKRDNFREMRKAAERFESTKHLGVGKGFFYPEVLIAEDFEDNGSYYRNGQYSPWHHELFYDDKGCQVWFSTREEAQAYIDSQKPIGTVGVGEKNISFRWTIGEKEMEHREKWSMGHGYYLGEDHYSGWNVRKWTFGTCIPEEIYRNAGRENGFFAYKEKK